MRGCVGALAAALALVLGAVPAHAQKKAQRAAAKPAISGPAKVEAILDELADSLWLATDMHWHKGEYNHILNLYKMITVARPSEVEAYANGGWLLWSMDRDAEAIALYEKGIRQNPGTYFMYDEVAQYYMTRKKDYRKAAEYWEKAVRFKDARPKAFNMLAVSYERVGMLDKARKAWERAARIPGNESAKRNLERFRLKHGAGPSAT